MISRKKWTEKRAERRDQGTSDLAKMPGSETIFIYCFTEARNKISHEENTRFLTKLKPKISKPLPQKIHWMIFLVSIDSNR